MLAAYGVLGGVPLRAAHEPLGLAVYILGIVIPGHEQTPLSFDPGPHLLGNLQRFGAYTLITVATRSFDTGRAISNAIAIVLVGPAVLTTLRRAAKRPPWSVFVEDGRATWGRISAVATFTSSDELQGARLTDGADLSGGRFVGSDLSGVVMRGVEVAEADVDAPWLTEAKFLRINGVDVIPFVEAELDQRFPGRAQRRAGDADGLRAALDRTRAHLGGDARAGGWRCLPARSTCRCTASGRSPRRCGTWSWRQTRRAWQGDPEGRPALPPARPQGRRW